LGDLTCVTGIRTYDQIVRFRLCIAVAMGLLAVPASADGYIFWSGYDSGKSRVGRAGLDGSGINPELVGNIYYGAGVATDGSYVYWGESGSFPSLAQIGRATVDGGDINHAFQQGATYCGIFGVDVLGSDLYWLKSDCSGRRINKAAKTGGQGSYTEPGAGSVSCGFTVDANYVYWSEGHYIARAPNVSPPVPPDKTWLDIGTGYGACDLAVDGSHIYWTHNAPEVPETGRADSIGRASIDGSEASVEHDFIVGTSFFIGSSVPSGIDVDGAFIYWTQVPAGQVVGSIGRANLDGTGVDYDFIPNVFDPTSVDVEGGGPPPAPPSPGGRPKRPPPPPMRIVVKGSSNSSFAPGSGSTAVRLSSGLASASKGVPKGTVFTYTLNQDAAVTVEVKRVKAGRLVGKKCKRPTKATAKKKKCDLAEHKLFRRGKQGKNTLPYTGRVKARPCGPAPTSPSSLRRHPAANPNPTRPLSGSSGHRRRAPPRRRSCLHRRAAARRGAGRRASGAGRGLALRPPPVEPGAGPRAVGPRG
jgi:hypothetical protein